MDARQTLDTTLTKIDAAIEEALQAGCPGVQLDVQLRYELQSPLPLQALVGSAFVADLDGTIATYVDHLIGVLAGAHLHAAGLVKLSIRQAADSRGSIQVLGPFSATDDDSPEFSVLWLKRRVTA